MKERLPQWLRIQVKRTVVSEVSLTHVAISKCQCFPTRINRAFAMEGTAVTHLKRKINHSLVSGSPAKPVNCWGGLVVTGTRPFVMC